MIGLIVAYTKDKTIGDKGIIPWKIKGEQLRFKQLTINNIVIMGKNSYEEIGKPLPNRINIIISNTTNYSGDNLLTVTSLEQAIKFSEENYPNKDIFICGGARLYEESLPLVDKLYITEINSNIKGDTKFPSFDESLFNKTIEESFSDEIPYQYVTYTRMNKSDYYMKDTIKKIMNDGYLDENPRPHYEDGTPAHTLSVNQLMYKYDLNKGEFPIGTLRPQAIKSGIAEILWIYQLQTSELKPLGDMAVSWWDEWKSQDRPNTIGQRYGATVRKYDQVNKVLKGLKENPFGRRHIISLWQEDDFQETDGLMPCAFQTLWNVRKNKDNKYYLDMTLIQRSSDWMMAGLINQCQYCCLLMMFARHCGYEVGVFTHFVQNAQIYDRHIESAKEILKREPIECSPKLILNEDKKDFYSFTIDDFKLVDYPREIVKEKNPQVKLEIGI